MSDMGNMQLIDPDDPAYFQLGSDVDWIRGDYVHGLEQPGVFARRHPWIVANRLFAETMVRSNPEQVLSILGALFSWRVCTISQLQAGLAIHGAPPFDRTEPNLYGALLRLGAISIGFDKRENLEGITLPQVWITVGKDSKLVKRTVNLINDKGWLKKTLTTTLFSAMRVHARHNTFASQLGLALAHDKRTRFTGGDGWGAFRTIDAQAVAEVGLNRVSSTDVVASLANNVLAGMEVQSSSHNLDTKIANWSKLLAYSPMNRRGLLCVWLFIKRADGEYCSYKSIFDKAKDLPEMMVGNPTVAQRMGHARWDDWFDHGQPTEHFGCYEDMLGATRSIFDMSWSNVAPTPRPMSAINDWGWQVMRDAIRQEWGWDASKWVMPEKYRGDFFGFIQGGADGDK